MKKLTMIGVAAIFALGLAAAAMAGGGYGDGSTSTTTTAAASTSTTTKKVETYSFKAKLTAAQEVPKPKAPTSAGGSFTARTVEAKTKTFTWKLSFHGLTGAAVAAHVHFGKKGVAGGVAIALCGPCKNGQTGKLTISGKAESAMEKGGAYVNVHTAKNAGGEIRGQVGLTGK